MVGHDVYFAFRDGPWFLIQREGTMTLQPQNSDVDSVLSKTIYVESTRVLLYW